MLHHRRIAAIILSLLLAFSICMFAACGQTADTAPPTITLGEDVPQSGVMGREVSLPTATAEDDKDGNLTESVRVTVNQLKADGTLVRELVYERPANVAQKFMPMGGYLNYEIIYFVRDSSGNRGELRFPFTAVEDTQAPTLSIVYDSITPSLDIEEGLTGQAGKEICLPSATGIDQPGDFDVTDRIKISIYINNDGNRGALWHSVTGTADVTAVRIPNGEYFVQYSLADGAENEADPVMFSLSVSAPDLSYNLIHDQLNFTFDSREGMGGFNEFGDLIIGHTSLSDPSINQPLGAVLNVMKIYEEYIGITFQVTPPPSEGGQRFYDIVARGSKDRGRMPQYTTFEWPPYLFLRIQATGKVDPRVSSSPDCEFNMTREYTGNFFDGNVHTLFVQWLNDGEKSTDQNAKIVLRGWVDKTPNESCSFEYFVTRGSSTTRGVLEDTIFDELFSRAGAGWLSIASASEEDSKTIEGLFDDDCMLVKGISIYPKDTTNFDVDIIPPILSAPQFQKYVALNEEISLPAVTADDNGADVTDELEISYSVNGGEFTTIQGNNITFTVAGQYRLLYKVSDSSGNLGYYEYKFDVAEREETPPVLNVDQTPINAVVGQPFDIPAATAQSAPSGKDLTSKIRVDYVGSYVKENITYGGAKTFTPYVIGGHELVYTVINDFGIETSKRVPVNVSGEKSGNVLNSQFTLTAGTYFNYGDQWIHDKKVSMVINVSQFGLMLFNIRGQYRNPQWPQGVVLRSNNSNGAFEISAYGHDTVIFGNADCPFAIWRGQNKDILFEFQFSEVEVNGQVYMKFQIWIDGQALKWRTKGNGGLLNVEGGTDATAIYRLKSDFTDRQEENLMAGPLQISSVANIGGVMTIKQLRVDGQSCVIENEDNN